MRVTNKFVSFFMVILWSFWFILSSAYAREGFGLIYVKGVVNTEEIGGNGLCVVSLWDKRPLIAISADGSFTVAISNQRPQKLTVRDGRKYTRALAIALPGHAEKIVFDARSTAFAVLFYDSSLFGDDQQVSGLLKRAENSPSFQELAGYLKKSLPVMSMEEINQSEEYMALLEKCNKELLGDDQQAIRGSLQNAKSALEKVL